jgi:hypothetical protein
MSITEQISQEWQEYKKGYDALISAAEGSLGCSEGYGTRRMLAGMFEGGQDAGERPGGVDEGLWESLLEAQPAGKNLLEELLANWRVGADRVIAG